MFCVRFAVEQKVFSMNNEKIFIFALLVNSVGLRELIEHQLN